MTPETEEKRRELRQFITQVLADETAVKGVVGVGDIATGHMHAASPINAVIFLDPLDLYIVPAAATWRATDDTFHSTLDERINGLRLNTTRLAWVTWSDPEFEWPEARKAELALGWIAHDPAGQVAKLINGRTAYSDDLRLQRLDESLIRLEQILIGDAAESLWEQAPPPLVLDRLAAAYHYLVQALFAYNRRWRVSRDQEMQALFRLPWLPTDFASRVTAAANSPGLDEAGYLARLTALRGLFQDLLTQLIDNGDYSTMAVDQAFLRYYEEPGRSWNLDEWKRFRQARHLPRNH